MVYRLLQLLVYFIYYIAFLFTIWLSYNCIDCER